MPSEEALERDLFLKLIAQVRRHDFFAILHFLMHEQFLFLHLLRSYISQDPVKRWKPDQSFEQEEFNVKHS